MDTYFRFRGRNMKYLFSSAIILAVTSLTGCASWNGGSGRNYTSENFQQMSSSQKATESRMKITRGSGYGPEVPYDQI